MVNTKNQIVDNELGPAERELTQIFIGKLSGKIILITHPQGLL